MENKKNKINKELDEFEDSTKYGEFISSFFTWNTLEGQKERARKLENLTKDKRGKRDKWVRGLNVRKKSIFPVLHRFTRMKKTTNGNGENRSFRTFNPRPHLFDFSVRVGRPPSIIRKIKKKRAIKSKTRKIKEKTIKFAK